MEVQRMRTVVFAAWVCRLGFLWTVLALGTAELGAAGAPSEIEATDFLHRFSAAYTNHDVTALRPMLAPKQQEWCIRGLTRAGSSRLGLTILTNGIAIGPTSTEVDATMTRIVDGDPETPAHVVFVLETTESGVVMTGMRAPEREARNADAAAAVSLARQLEAALGGNDTNSLASVFGVETADLGSLSSQMPWMDRELRDLDSHAKLIGVNSVGANGFAVEYSFVVDGVATTNSFPFMKKIVADVAVPFLGVPANQ